MGVIKRGILGGFSNKVGNIVGSTWKGIAIVKSLPLSVANPRTAGQVLQRSKFKNLTVLGSLLLSPIIKPLWDRFANQMSGFNAFISANQSAFDIRGEIDPYGLLMSRGRMIAPADITGSISGSNWLITLTNPENDRFALPTDRVFIVGLSGDAKKVAFASVTSTQRGALPTVQVTTNVSPNVGLSDVAYIYAGYLRSDGSEVSNSFVYIP